MEPHDEFLELCAVSMSGELSEQEQAKLSAHLAGCAECRQALKEFEATVDLGIPLLASTFSPEHREQSTSPEAKPAEVNQATSSGEAARLFAGKNDAQVAADLAHDGFAFAARRGHAPTKINWNHVWFSFAACVLLTIALGIYAYRIGKSHSVVVTEIISGASDVQIEALERQISDAGHEREGLRLELAKRNRVISDLRHEIQLQSASLDEMKGTEASLEKSFQSDEAARQQAAQDRSNLAQKLDDAQALLEKTQAELDSLERQRDQNESRAASLEAQVNDLHAQLHEREETIGKQQDLLAHDRDVRELMAARNLHIEDIYNVSGDGTQKPTGRVFYTKGKSLVFYAYDLDQHSSLKNARTFQAWGRRGPDRRQALNLGIFYEDDAAKKRWVVRFDDAKTLEQIDAVFVTVEPSGGSPKPSGSPFLFTYLKIEPNHP
jgi:Anti-sigma-K factor rskA/Putative zinc-finger